MKLAIVGLGKMGSQIAIRLQESGHKVIGCDVGEASRQRAEASGIHTAAERETAVKWFGDERPVVWIMIPAGAVAGELQAWLDVLPADSVIIDGGNSDFRDTKKHAELAGSHNVQFVDVGTSGGIMGITEGFSMMVGGDEPTVTSLDPILDSLSQPHGAHHYFGPHGAGHYVKMVHNAIEYGMMESLAEGYHILHDGPYAGLDLAAIAEVWRHGSIINSELNNLAAAAFRDNPELSGVDGYVAESGEARWTLEVAKEHDMELPAIQSALDVRLASQSGKISFATKLLAELRNKFGGHAINKT
ncbi:MAG TPA: NADP-dependent phosphogluconate dehydrogenase [Candidatus Saccharimonadales bacterium]